MSSTSAEQTKTTAQDGFGSAGTPPSNTRRSAAGDRLYRVIWRWHFYAGMIITLPLIVVSATGALYIFKDELEGVLHPGVTYVEPAAKRVSYDQQLAAARAALAGGILEDGCVETSFFHRFQCVGDAINADDDHFVFHLGILESDQSAKTHLIILGEDCVHFRAQGLNPIFH